MGGKRWRKKREGGGRIRGGGKGDKIGWEGKGRGRGERKGRENMEGEGGRISGREVGRYR